MSAPPVGQFAVDVNMQVSCVLFVRACPLPDPGRQTHEPNSNVDGDHHRAYIVDPYMFANTNDSGRIELGHDSRAVKLHTRTEFAAVVNRTFERTLREACR